MENWNNINTGMGLGNMIGRQYNGFNPAVQPYSAPAPHYEIIKVNGEAGARNFRMGPNSSALLLDETAAIVWLAQTDGTGYLTVTPFDLAPHQAAPQVDLNKLVARVSALEEIINGNNQSNSFSNKQYKKQRQQPAEPASNSTD